VFVDCDEVYPLTRALPDYALLLAPEVLVDLGLHGVLLFGWVLAVVLSTACVTYKVLFSERILRCLILSLMEFSCSLMPFLTMA
jgi:hypothetical protein